MYRSILERELGNWESFASNLEKTDKNLFNQLLKFAYKYSGAIEAKGELLYTIIVNVFIVGTT
jgi:hypothetical protein